MPSPRREAKRERSTEARIAREKAARRKRTTRFVAIVTVLIVAFVGVGSLTAGSSFLGGSDDNSSSTAAPTTAAPPTPCPAADGSSPRRIDFATPPVNCIDPAKKYSATFDTSEGRVVVDLDTQRTPQTTNNFVALARYHYYDNTTIFRTSPQIDIIQGGSPHTNDNSDRGPGYNIQDEGGSFTYSPGDLVMARSQGPDSASAQYFFGTGPNVSNLDSQGNYVTFGKTREGLDVLKKIIGLHSGDPSDGAPSKPVTVKTITITES